MPSEPWMGINQGVVIRNRIEVKFGHRTPRPSFNRLRREKFSFWTSGAPEPQLGPRAQPGLVGPSKNRPFFSGQARASLTLVPVTALVGTLLLLLVVLLTSTAPPRRWCSPTHPPRRWWSPASTSSSTCAHELRGPRPE